MTLRATSRGRARQGGAGLEDIEIALLLEGIHRRYGFDFRSFARATLRRRILERVKGEKARTVSGLQEVLLRDPAAFDRFVTGVASGGRGLFAHARSDRGFRAVVAPALRERSRPRVWQVGCATGEELYSTAVLLAEERLAERSQVYATELHEAPLRKAEEGAFPLPRLRAAEAGYRAAGGTGLLADYYQVAGERGVFRDELRHNVVFAAHNYMTDSTFNEFDVVLCRGLLSELSYGLQHRLHRLLYDSLAPGGYLLLGRGEDVNVTPFAAGYEAVVPHPGLFRRAS